MQPPPSRYKVVEQGRRLVVIDTWNGDRPITRQPPKAAQPMRPPPSVARPTTPEQARAALHMPPRPSPGGGPAESSDLIITTQDWFDAKAPRRVKLEGSAAGLIAIVSILGGLAALYLFFEWGWPVLIAIGFFLSQKKVRAGLRTAVTAWLDTQPIV